MTDAFEGSVIRCMRRLEELMRQMCQASKAIGNTELENKFAEGKGLLYKYHNTDQKNRLFYMHRF